MVGGALCRLLAQDQSIELITADRSQLDLTEQAAVRAFFQTKKIDQVYLAAAKVGGIHANNTYPADFIYQNLMIEANILEAAYQTQVGRLLFLGSSCIYPKEASQPMKESALLTGPLEPTNEPYAIAKIAGIKLCESYHRQHGCDFRSVMPTNLYGPGDNYHPENSHVIPALIRRIHQAKVEKAKMVTIWGTGKPRREFLYVDDMARACVHVMGLESACYWAEVSPMCSHLNVGSGLDGTIQELAQTIASVVGFEGDLEFDTSKPDGTMRKLLDVELIRQLGWQAEVDLKSGLELAYKDYLRAERKLR